MKLFGIGFIVGAIASLAIAFGFRPAPVGVDPALADSLRVAIAAADSLAKELAAADAKAVADSSALAASSRKIRLEVDSSIAPSDTVIEGTDTVYVFRVAPAVAAHVEKASSRIASMQVQVSKAQLLAIAERNAREIAVRAKEQAERALAEEQARRLRYRAEGAVGALGLVGILALIFGG